MNFIQGVVNVKDGRRLVARIVDNAVFSRVHPKWHTKAGFTVELKSGPIVLPTLDKALEFIRENKGNEIA